MNGNILLRSILLIALLLTSVSTTLAEWVSNASVSSVPLGGSFHLTCQLSKRSTVIWSLNEQPLGFGNVLFSEKLKDRYTLSKIENGGELRVENAHREDSGLFKCQATDVPDLHHAISVLSAPTLAVNCSNDTGQLEWKIDEEAISKEQSSASSIRIERKQRQEQNWTLVQEVAGEEEQAEVKLMVADQVFRIVWKDNYNLGIEWASNVAPMSKCTAPEDVPLANPTDVQASILKEDGEVNLLVYWTPIPEDYEMGSGFNYLLRYKGETKEEWEEIRIYSRTQYKYIQTLSNEQHEENNMFSIEVLSANDLGVCALDAESVNVKINTNTNIPSDSKGFISSPGGVIPVSHGGLLNIQCQHQQQDIYPLVWYKDSEIIAVMGYKVLPDDRITVNAGMLKIQNMDYNDAGEYTCEIQSNPPTNVSYLVVVGSTVPVYRLSSNCYSDIAELYWESCFGRPGYYNPNHPTCYEQHSYRRLNDSIKQHLRPSSYTVTATSPNSPTIEKTVKERITRMRVRPNHQYSFRLSSTNIFGRYYYPYSEDCKTEPGVPWRNPGDIAISRSLSNITVFWQPLLKYEQHASEFAYKVRYSDGLETKEQKVQNTFFEIQDINEKATYTISITSTNSMGDCEELATNHTSYPLEDKEIMDECLLPLIPSEDKTTVEAKEGDSVTLRCDNSENRKIVWRRLPTGNIISMDDVIILEDPRISIVDNDLSIDSVESDDFGYYQCVIYSKRGTGAYLWKLTKEE